MTPLRESRANASRAGEGPKLRGSTQRSPNGFTAATAFGSILAPSVKTLREEKDMKRPRLPISMLVAVAAVVLPAFTHAERRDEFQLMEATIAHVQEANRSVALTPADRVRMYLARIPPHAPACPDLTSC